MVKAVPRPAHSGVRAPTAAPGNKRLAELERAENFPVALKLLPRTVRDHLRTIYDVARVIDDTGDEGDGDHTADLLALGAELNRVWSDEPPRSGLLGRLAATVQACHLEAEPFNRLIEANLVDQKISRYPLRSDLRDYCTLSADPIGRLVLAIFGATTAQTVALSDQICTGLQILEHCQDVGEDYRRGRIYLALEDLDRYGVSESEFTADQVSWGLRHAVRATAQNAHDMLTAGEPLIGLLHGTARIAVAGYLAGGKATFDALRAADWQVLPAGPRPRRTDTARHAAGLLVRAARPAHRPTPPRPASTEPAASLIGRRE
jgi:squalene synthase HpnC